MEFNCFPSVSADALTQVFPSQTKSNLLIRKNMFDIMAKSGITTKKTIMNTIICKPHFRFILRAHRAARDVALKNIARILPTPTP